MVNFVLFLDFNEIFFKSIFKIYYDNYLLSILLNILNCYYSYEIEKVMKVF